MNKQLKVDWLAALRSGHYKQGRKRLRDGSYFCCLGVLCDLANRNLRIGRWEYAGLCGSYFFTYKGNAVIGFIPSNVLDVIGLPLMAARSLSAMNDGGASFQEIADYIEAHIN